MSGSSKQPAAGGPQMRFTSPYQPMQPQLQPRETFQLPNQNYVQTQSNQGGNQGAGLRGIPQTGPPNQAPTPPNQDLKVQAVTPQAPMNIYQQQSAVRPTQTFNFRPQGPPNQTPRMANNQHRGQQQIFQPTQPAHFVQMPVQSGMYINPMSYYNSPQQRQTFVQQPVALLPGQHFAYPTFQPTAITQSAQSVPFSVPYYPIPQRAGPPQQPTSTPSNSNQALLSAMPLQQPISSHQPGQRPQKRRPNAIPIIHPVTGLNVGNEEETYNQHSSHPPSGESSARQTPQPAPNNPNKEVQATFAKQVAQVLSNDESSYDEDRLSLTGDHMDPPPVFHPPPLQAVHNNAKYEHIVQTSVLKAHAKEFVLPSAKETPIVSAMCDSEEVTLPNKQPKGKESPAKLKKRDVKEHHREAPKEVHAPKEAPPAEKQQAPIVKEEPPKVKEPIVPVVSSQPVAKPAERETDKRKKETKSDNKPSEVNSNDPAVQLNPNQEQEPAAPTNAKTKQNASQRKEAQKPNQKAAAPHVPPPQPAKSGSKTSKKNEINNKGASKEGTEMDVFQIADKVNANAPLAPNNSDVINANAVAPVTNNAPPVINNTNNVKNVVESNNKKNESNDAATIKPVPEAKPVQKKVVDVTNIFGGNVPKPSPFVPPPSTDANRDETDRAAHNDKMILAKNEANAGSSNKAKETKPELPYKQGQWSPSNQEGEKKYDFDFLLAVRELPISKMKPPNLSEIVDCFDGNRQRMPDNRYSMGRSDFSNSLFMSPYGGKNSSMKGPQSITKHPSLKGNMNNKGGKPNMGTTKISISLREEIKLHETENAWKPGRLSKPDIRTDEEKKTDELYKKVRGVLNKLTPQKFDTLLKQIKELEIDNVERLQGVIDLIFEKAVDEPNFSVAYAKMCRELSVMQVPAGPDKKSGVVNFRKLLINRCQEEFEKQSNDETSINEKKKEIETCTDPDKKKDLEFELEEIYRRIRMRSVGNIRFIGELFKIQMLTANIMLTCLSILLSIKDEESLECLCKLLATVGKELDKKTLDKFFSTMQDIVDKKDVKCSSRIRFMLQDAIDLRKNNWVPRRQDINPKTIDQIQKEAENEQLNQAINNSISSNTPRKDERMRGDMNKGKRTTDDGWTVQTRNMPLSFNKEKLKIRDLENSEPLGSANTFQSWCKGSGMRSQPSTQHTLTNPNKFACLDSGSLDFDKKMSGSGRFKESYNSKGSSLERGSYNKQSYDNRAGSRSGSQHRMHDNLAPPMSQRMPPPSLPVVPSAPVAPVKPTPPPTPAHQEMTEDQMERYFKNCIDEFINDNCTFEECENDIRSTFPVSYMPRIVADGYLGVIEKFATTRLKTGMLFAKLIKVGTLPLEEYCMGLEEIFSQVEDLIIDIPTIWNCLAEILLHPICEEALPLNRLQKSCEVLIGNGVADKLLAPVFKLIVSEKGPNFLRQVWEASELKLSNFMPDSKLEKFVEENKLEFLTGGETLEGSSNINYQQIEKKLLEFFERNAPFDDVCNWITANVGERVKENLFIRTLATAIYKFSIDRTKLDPEKLSRHYKLFHKYVDNNQAYELQCLYALQSLINQLEHPQGLLLSIFNKLSEDVIFPQESFIAWENSEDPAEQENKGVAVKQLTAFFTQLKENDDDDECGSTGSEEA